MSESRFKITTDGEIYPLAAAPPVHHMRTLLAEDDISAVKLTNKMVLVMASSPSEQHRNPVAEAVLHANGWPIAKMWGPVLLLPAADIVGSGLYVAPIPAP
jgi:hypothetical protein